MGFWREGDWALCLGSLAGDELAWGHLSKDSGTELPVFRYKQSPLLLFFYSDAVNFEFHSPETKGSFFAAFEQDLVAFLRKPEMNL